jgi:hypothetical protein
VTERRKAIDKRAERLQGALDRAASPDDVLQVVDDINSFARESGPWLRTELLNGLRDQAQRTLRDSIPAQIAALLRPIPQADRAEVVDKALALLAPRG